MSETNEKPEPDRIYEPKVRSCLRCQDNFDSSWPGERVCKRCKSTDGWRNSSSFEAA